MSFQELIEIARNKVPGQLLTRVEVKGSSIVLPQELLKYIGSDSKFLKKPVGELLLPTEARPIQGTNVVISSEFHSKGYRHLIMTVTNPVWAQNPASINAALLFSISSGGTGFRLQDPAGPSEAVIATLNIADSTSSVYVLSMCNPGDKFLSAVPIPDIGESMTIAIEFTPTGTAEAQNIDITVYGIG